MLSKEVRHPGRSVSEDPGSPAVDISRGYRIKVRYDNNDKTLRLHALFGQY